MDASVDVRKERDAVLDAWRGVGIVGVLLQHFVYFRYDDVFRTFSYAVPTSAVGHFFVWLDKLFIAVSVRAGEYGVESFFIISGYIITTLLLLEEDKAGTINVRSFYFRRVFRILPAYLFYVACIVLFGALGWITMDYAQLPAALGFLCNTSLGICDWNLTHTWTLATEEQFYILWPLLFILVPRKHRAAFIAFLIGLFLGLSMTGLLFAHGWTDNGRSFVCISLGVLVALLPSFRIAMHKYAFYVSLGMLALFGALDFMPGLSGLSHLLFRESTPLFILTAILLTYRIPKSFHSTRFAVLLSQLGLMSYSVYLWQEVFTNDPASYAAHSPFSTPVLLVPLILLSYFAVERPMMRWSKAYLKKDNWFSRLRNLPYQARGDAAHYGAGGNVL